MNKITYFVITLILIEKRKEYDKNKKVKKNKKRK